MMVVLAMDNTKCISSLSVIDSQLKILTTYANKLMDFMEYIADLRQGKYMKYNISFVTQ